MEHVYRTPDVKWQYRYFVEINGFSYEFGDREPMVSVEDAQLAMTHVVENNSNVPVNILGPLTGKFVGQGRFVGKVRYADDLDDGSDYDPDTERDVEVVITCSQVRHNTEYGE